MKRTTLLGLIEAAVKKRDFKRGNRAPLRLFDGVGDGVPGLSIDFFGAMTLIHVLEQEQQVLNCIERLGEEIFQLVACDSVYLRVHAITANKSANSPAKLLSGTELESLWVEEFELEFLIRPQQINAGFFIDSRNLRVALREHSMGKRVLNTFAFTGALGVAAHVGGAKEVVQVDISKAGLSWAKENFERNRRAEPNASVRFIAEDCRTFIARELRRIDKGRDPYDIVVIDPPSYGSSAGKPFRLKSEIPKLIESGMKLLAPDGVLFFTCNSMQIDTDHLERVSQKTARLLGKKIKTLDVISAPSDFPTAPHLAPSIRGVELCIA